MQKLNKGSQLTFTDISKLRKYNFSHATVIERSCIIELDKTVKAAFVARLRLPLKRTLHLVSFLQTTLSYEGET